VCRWVGYRGAPIAPAELLHDPERSLIEQSRRHAPNMAIPNGDGTGLGWYDRRADPAWGDENLVELATEIRSPLFLAHVRAGTGTPVQQTNCHPFRYRNWLFVHNGYVADYEVLRRELLLAVRPDLFTNIVGSTDSEVLFHLALTSGLAEDPIAGLERMAGFVEATAASAGASDAALQMTVGVSEHSGDPHDLGQRFVVEVDLSHRYHSQHCMGPYSFGSATAGLLFACGAGGGDTQTAWRWDENPWGADHLGQGGPNGGGTEAGGEGRRVSLPIAYSNLRCHLPFICDTAMRNHGIEAPGLGPECRTASGQPCCTDYGVKTNGGGLRCVTILGRYPMRMATHTPCGRHPSARVSRH
jgi:predicted glutamine amidotransferase